MLAPFVSSERGQVHRVSCPSCDASLAGPRDRDIVWLHQVSSDRRPRGRKSCPNWSAQKASLKSVSDRPNPTLPSLRNEGGVGCFSSRYKWKRRQVTPRPVHCWCPPVPVRKRILSKRRPPLRSPLAASVYTVCNSSNPVDVHHFDVLPAPAGRAMKRRQTGVVEVGDLSDDAIG
ncbi:unnamed protein product [Protopolystoma xenopodis]|uniref:Uncharacterized protein n=1 Tax=Protopolystoma xenopodis TaxID=117903 RepID=A0A448X1V2_9PLAT|nr:unnamed protein product [Protopolystoma xenopodis]